MSRWIHILLRRPGRGDPGLGGFPLLLLLPALRDPPHHGAGSLETASRELFPREAYIENATRPLQGAPEGLEQG